MTFAKRLREIRGADSQEEFAKKAGVSQQLITKIEGGKTKESRKASLLAKAGGVNVDWLLHGTGPKQSGDLGEAKGVLGGAELAIARHEGDIDQLRRTLAAVLDWASRSVPGAADQLERMLSSETESYVQRGGQAIFLDVIRTARTEAEAAQAAARPRAKRGSSRKSGPS